MKIFTRLAQISPFTLSLSKGERCMMRAFVLRASAVVCGMFAIGVWPAGLLGEEAEVEQAPDQGSPSASTEGRGQAPEAIQVAQAPGPGVGQAAPQPDSLDPALLSLDFRQADLLTVLQALSRKAKINIVTSLDVAGEVTIHLEEVTWEQALDTIVKTSGLAYEKEDNVILVTTVESLKTRREAYKELVEIEPVSTKVIQLRYLDAADVKAFLEPQLTAQGKISVLEITGQKGWGFGGAEGGESGGGEERGRAEREKARSKAIVITDTPTTIDRLEKILARVDVLPKQILIEARVMEVSRDLLQDIGLSLVTGGRARGTGLTNLSASKFSVTDQFTPTDASTAPNRESVSLVQTEAGSKQGSTAITDFAGTLMGGSFTPSAFVPKATGLTPAAAGFQMLFRKLAGTEFSALLQLLEEDVRTNTLSAPHILTLSGQEASILVGTKHPILETQVSGSDSTTTTTTLSYYQDIGIELFVVPQVSGDKHIDMIIHPVVSAQSGSVTTNTNVSYPILEVREAETQVLMENGETIVIGGLLKDAKSKSRVGLPVLGKLPFLGPLFSRATTDVAKIDLLIFITTRIVEPGGLPDGEAQRLRRQYEEFLRGQFLPEERDARRAAPPARSTQGPAAAEDPEAQRSSAKKNRGVLYRKSR